MSIINYAVEIITGRTEFTNTAYGLVDGVFRYITGRPEYTGSYPSGDYPTTVLSRTPINYWRFQETSGDTAVDSAGSSDFVSIYDPTFGLTGPTEVPGDTSLLSGGNLNSPTVLNIDNIDEVLFESWIYIPAIEDSKSFEFSIQHDWGNNVGSYFSFRLNTGTGDPSMGVSMLTTGEYTDPYIEINSMEYPSTGWHYFIVTYKDKILTAYVDGVVKGTDTNLSMSTISFKTAPAMYLGAYYRVCETALYTNDWYTSLVTKDWYNYLGTTGPTWEDSTPNTDLWYEGFLLKDGMSNPSREIDISRTGDYGTLSGFNFTLRNDILLWTYIRDNGIYFTNREIRLYCVMDNTFYQIWTGVIQNNPYDSIGYQFICADSFKRDHKPLPPEIITKAIWANTSPSAEGECIPVTIGDCTYAKLQLISYEPELDTHVIHSVVFQKNFEIKCCGASHYATEGLEFPTLKIINKNVGYNEDDLKDHYLYVTKGGGNPNTDEMIRIRSNTDTIDGETVLELETTFDFSTEELFNQRYSYDPKQGTNWEVVFANEADDYYFCRQGSPIVKEMENIHYGTWLRYDGLDFSNGGTGCNQILVSLATYGSGVMKIRLDAVDGEIIGEYPITRTFPDQYNYLVDIKKQYGVSQTIFFTFEDSTFGGATTFGAFFWFRLTHNKSDTETWWFSTVAMPASHVISTGNIVDFVKDSYGDPLVYIYNSKTDEMERTPSISVNQLIDNSGSLGHPEMIMYSSKLQKDGTLLYQVPIQARDWEIKVPKNGFVLIEGVQVQTVNQNSTKLTNISLSDRDMSSSLDITFPQNSKENSYSFEISLGFPASYVDQEFEKMYVAFDGMVHTDTADFPLGDPSVRMFAKFNALDAYGNVVEELEENLTPDFFFPIDEGVADTNDLVLNFLSQEYYRNNGVLDASTPRLWSYVGEDGNSEVTTMKSLLELPDNIWQGIRSGTATNVVKITVTITSEGLRGTGNIFDCTVSMKEAGFIGYKSINPLSDDFYVRVKGESIGGLESNTVYRAFKLMMETYDGLTDIDYTNLPYIRDDWGVGRQLTEQASSFDYIQSLAKESFVAVYPSRLGKRTLRAWRDPYIVGGVDIEPTRLELPIIYDSIVSWESTSIADLFNDYRIEYNFNPVTNRPGNVIILTNADQTALPGIGVMSGSHEEWLTWLSGVFNGSYSDSLILWQAIREAYDRANAKQPLTDDLRKLYWYTNQNVFEGKENLGVSTEESAYKFLDNCVRWTSRQKAIVNFSTTLTTESVPVELLRTVIFNDPIYTNGESRSGWINKIEFDVKNDVIKLGYMLEPEDEIIDNLINERGPLLNYDTHNEDGTRDDQIDDGQDRT